MLAEALEIKGLVELIENSGIQFLDYKFSIDWSDKTLSPVTLGRFAYNGAEPPVRFAPTDDPLLLFDPRSGKEISIADAEAQTDKTVKVQESAALFDGVWFPVPFFNSNNHQLTGPTNWVRARVFKVSSEPSPSDPDKTIEHYRITYAVDTTTSTLPPGDAYYLPCEADVQAGSNFEMCKDYGKLCKFIDKDARGNSFADSWCQSVYQDLAPERLRNVRRSQCGDRILDKEHIMHYLNMLALLQHIPESKLNDLHLIGFDRSQTGSRRQVSLVLDIGNSRSCGLLFEEGDDSTTSLKARRLMLRDFNAPHEVYAEPFQSRVEFSKPDFDFDGNSAKSGHIQAFSWPSVARVGTEAARLAAMRCGNEGRTGLTSPKRYLWSTDPITSNDWNFNPYSYLIESEYLQEKRRNNHEPVWSQSVSRFMCSSGNTFFNPGPDDTIAYIKAQFSKKSMMTFMLLEIFAQTLMQINSLEYRLKTDSKGLPRCLKNVILTYPPAMSLQEKKLFHSCAEDALGILWKSMNYDRSEPYVKPAESNDIYPALPRLYLDWNEAEGAQIVYLYNETQEIFGGNGSRFLEFIRRADADGRFMEETQHPDKNILARFASIDIGGGTTDLTIRDYAFPRGRAESEAQIVAAELLRDGFKIAGDDILRDIINESIVQKLQQIFREHGLSTGNLTNVIGNSGEGSDENIRTLRQQVTQRIFMPVALRIMFHLEQSFTPGRGIPRGIKVRGSIADFLLGREENAVVDKDPNIEKPAPALLSLEEISEVLDFINGSKGLGHYLKDGFKLEDMELEVDLSAMNQDFASGLGWNLCKQLDYLCEVIAMYRCDVLLLTGRPSKISGIRSFFAQRLNLSPARIISMHQYQCSGSWYPFATAGGRIGDPKSTAAVGAMLSFVRREYFSPVNFRYFSPIKKTNTMRFVGVTDDNNKMENPLYRLGSIEAENQVKQQSSDDFGSDGLEEITYVRCRLNADSGQFDSIKGDSEAPFAVMLPANLGYKQFSCRRFDAMPLYRLEVITDPELALKKNKDHITLRSVELNGADPESFFKMTEELSSVRKGGGREHDQKIVNLIAAAKNEIESLKTSSALQASQNLTARKDALRAQLMTRLEAEMTAFTASLQPAGGLKKLFGRGQKEQEAQIAQKRTVLTQKYGALFDSQCAALDAQSRAAGDDDLAPRIRAVLRKCRNQIDDELRQMVDDKLLRFKRDVIGSNQNVEISLRPASDFIISGSGDKEQIVGFEIENASAEGSSDLGGLINLRLYTVSKQDENYWVDTGVVMN